MQRKQEGEPSFQGPAKAASAPLDPNAAREKSELKIVCLKSCEAFDDPFFYPYAELLTPPILPIFTGVSFSLTFVVTTR